jgi:hypothetical protein
MKSLLLGLVAAVSLLSIAAIAERDIKPDNFIPIATTGDPTVVDYILQQAYAPAPEYASHLQHLDASPREVARITTTINHRRHRGPSRMLACSARFSSREAALTIHPQHPLAYRVSLLTPPKITGRGGEGRPQALELRSAEGPGVPQARLPGRIPWQARPADTRSPGAAGAATGAIWS